MKWFAILVFGLLAESSIGKHDGEDEVNMNLISETFSDAVRSVATPSIENGDNLGPEFVKKFTEVVLHYSHTLMARFDEQAVKAGDNLIAELQKYSDRLQQAIVSTDEEGLTVDDDLNTLITQLNIFLGLIPGNALIKRQALPELPPQPTEVISRTTDRTANELFLNAAKALDDNFSTYYGFIASIFLEGWRSVRPIFNTVQTQIRNKILNGPVMAAYRKAVKRVLDQSSVVEGRVKPETWERFKGSANRIIEISNDCN